MASSGQHQDIKLVTRAGPLVAIAVFSFFSNSLLLTVPLYMFQIFDRVVSSGSMATLGMLTLIAAFALAVQAAIDVVRGRILVRLGLAFERRLAKEVLLSLIGRSGRGHLATAQSLRDLQEVRSFFTGNALLTLLDAPWIPIYVCILFLFHPMFGLVGLLGSFLLLAIAALNNSLSGKGIKAVSNTSNKSFAQADNILRNAEVVRAMGMAGMLADRWQHAGDRSIIAYARAADWTALLGASAKEIRLFLQIAVMGVGVYLVLEKDVTSGVLMAASLLMARALAPVEAAISSWRSTTNAFAAYERLKETLGELRARPAPMVLPKPVGHLSIESVNYIAEGRDEPLLRNIQFQLKAGESLGIIGPSGSGKSTLCRMLVGIEHPTHGVVRIDGSDVTHWDPDRLGPHIGYLPQEVQLLAGTVRDNIARMRDDIPPEWVIEAAKRAGIHELILRLPSGYDTDIGDAGGVLSGGERQRLGLARALLGEPCLLVLDEPNAHLDPYGEDSLVKALAVAKRRGATSIIVSHRPSILKRVDKLLVLRAGSIELFGPAADVIGKLKSPMVGGAELQPLPPGSPAKPARPNMPRPQQPAIGIAQESNETSPLSVAEKR